MFWTKAVGHGVTLKYIIKAPVGAATPTEATYCVPHHAAGVVLILARTELGGQVYARRAKYRARYCVTSARSSGPLRIDGGVFMRPKVICRYGEELKGVYGWSIVLFFPGYVKDHEEFVYDFEDFFHMIIEYLTSADFVRNHSDTIFAILNEIFVRGDRDEENYRRCS